MSDTKRMEGKQKLPIQWERGKDFVPYLYLFGSLFVLFSLISFEDSGQGIEANWFGRIGYFFSYGMYYLFGLAAFVPGILLAFLGIMQLYKPSFDALSRLFYLPLYLFTWAITMDVFSAPGEALSSAGGFLGHYLQIGLAFIFGSTGLGVINLFLHISGLIILMKDSPVRYMTQLLQRAMSILKNGTVSILSSSQRSPMVDQTKGESAPPWLEKSPEAEPSRHTFFQRQKESLESRVRDREIPFPETKVSSVTESIPARSSHSTKYRTSRAFSGKFGEDRKVYFFAPVSESVRSKMDTGTELAERVAIQILDFRSSRSSVRKESEYQPVSESYDTTESEPEFPDESTPWNSEDDRHSSVAILEEKVEETEQIPAEDQYSDFEDAESTEEDYLEDSEWDDSSEDSVQEELEEYDSDEELYSEGFEPANSHSLVPEISVHGKYHLSTNSLATNGPEWKEPLFRQDSDKVAKKIEEIIKQYGYESKVVSLERGPIITRYELAPPPGVKLTRITSLQDELKLYLAVKSIRMVAPIPGKSTIGIEVPNQVREDVFLGDLLRQMTYLKSKKDLSIPLGKDISGKPVSIDLNRLPHLLVAGTTGSGKSVCLNSMISSLVIHRSPEEVRFIMIDPKMVELTLYQDIPHLLMPVITDPKKASKALQWAIQEMEARYTAVSELRCRDFKSYNDKVESLGSKTHYKKMPYIVIFIDELADLMMVSGKELEEAITRITQKSRAVGIHLVMATQRPSVDVITGLIKANCPARIAFHVAQKMDSKVILDASGAETLLGQGDLLYKSPTSADFQRIQSPFVSENEIEKIVDDARKFGKPSYVQVDLEDSYENSDYSEEDENLFDEAWEIVRSERKASASYLQRRLKIGYNRAARIIELMERRGYVGPATGNSKPRDILR